MKRISIAEAKQNLPRLVHDVEAGAPVELTRRGSPVAVLVSRRAYTSLLGNRPSLWEAVAHFREQLAVAQSDDDDPWTDVRDRSPGRPVSL